jgi:hypothetical protein
LGWDRLGWVRLGKVGSGVVMLQIITTHDSGQLTVLLAKHITSCDNVFLKVYFLPVRKLVFIEI